MMAAVAVMLICGTAKAQPKDKIVVAYVCSWTDMRLPDPTLMTHINYAFGHVNKSFNGCDIQNPPFLRQVVALKRQNPKLKVMLSVGGWTSGNFSEMAADARNRAAFAKDCRRIVDKYGLDGIDIDWEYPTSSEAGISSSPDDTKNFTLLMRDLRKALGKKKLLTAATIADGIYVDFPACIRYMDFVNIMAYDVANPPKHHTTLFRSPLSGRITASEAVQAHIKAGVPKQKLCLGMPLYGRGDHSNKILDKYVKTGYTDGRYQEQWDSVGMVPYLTDRSGALVWGFDNARSLAAKCQYILDQDLLGGMYWECTEDNAQLDEMTTVFLSLLKNKKGTVPQKHVLVMTDGTQSQNTTAGLQWLRKVGNTLNFDVTEFPQCAPYTAGYFNRFHLIYMLNGNPSTLTDEARRDFETYIEQAHGSYYCMPHDAVAEWKWYSDFSNDTRINQAVRSTFFGNGVWCPQYWTNTSKHARNIFYQGNDNLDWASNMQPYLQMERDALRWLLHE